MRALRVCNTDSLRLRCVYSLRGLRFPELAFLCEGVYSGEFGYFGLVVGFREGMDSICDLLAKVSPIATWAGSQSTEDVRLGSSANTSVVL